MAQSIVALNSISSYGNNVRSLSFLPKFRANFNSLSSSHSFPINYTNPRKQFRVRCASGGLIPSIIKSVKKWSSVFAKRFKPLPSVDFWDHMTYLEITRCEAGQFAVDEFNRRENKALHLDRILKTNYTDNVELLYTFELETTDEGGCRRVYNAVVRCPFEGKNELLEFSEVEVELLQ